MKKFKNILIALSVVSLTGCDYLDIVPDEQTTQYNMYDTPAKAKNYLNACYGYIPNSRASEALDKMTGGEIAVANEEKNEWSKFARGYYSPAAPGLAQNYWESCYNGIRTCWQFLSVIDKTPKLPEEDLIYYKAEAHLLIAYYHWLILRAFGPAVIVDQVYDYTTPYIEYPERSTYDECVTFIDKQIQLAIDGGLKKEQFFETNEYGRLTKWCALALRSRMYLYAASPLFNGNSEFYSNFKNSKGEHLISQEYSVEKWKKAVEVTKDAIEQMKAAGFDLYDKDDAGKASAAKPGMDDQYERAVRWAFIDNDGNNNEVIWGDTRQESGYMISNQSSPYQQKNDNGFKNAWSLIAPTMETVKRFYTKNGLPIDEDPNWEYANNWDETSLLTAKTYAHDQSYLGGCTAAGLKKYAAGAPLLNDTVLNLNLGREPRFYAWIGFHNGPFEISQFYGVAITGTNRIVKLDLKYGQEQGWDGRPTNYSISGYLNKKCVSPLYKTGPGADHYPYPVFRMAEMYLNYAEALIETQEEANFTEAKKYIDLVRSRAGIDGIDKAWKNSKSGLTYANSYKGLQAIVRQERQIEFYMENHRFWDLRRWKDAESLGKVPEGMNISGATDELFLGTIKKLNVIRNFAQKNYLMPIPVGETDKVPQVIQNPGY